MYRILLLIFIFTSSIMAKDSLVCNVENNDDILKIKCKYKTTAKDFDRNISMSWESPSTPQDNRLRTIVLPANNRSTYDFRYFDGRADGSWNISATDESSGKTTSVIFIKKDLAELKDEIKKK